MPTKELAEQATQHLKQLTAYLDQEVTPANAASGTTAHLQRSPLLHNILSRELNSELVQNNHVGETRYHRRDSFTDPVTVTV